MPIYEDMTVYAAMTVYSLMEITNEGGYLMGVYSTRENAEAAAARLGLDPTFPRCIMEYDLDSVPWTDKTNIMRSGRR